jgi:hypothetical protein
MPGLYKPSIVAYRLPDGSYRTPDSQRVTKDTPDAVRTVERSRRWYGRYTDAGARLSACRCRSRRRRRGGC